MTDRHALDPGYYRSYKKKKKMVISNVLYAMLEVRKMRSVW